MRVWDGLLGETDKMVLQKAGYGKKRGFGKKPVLIVVDVTYSFVGLKPEPVLKSIDTFPTSCGENGWKSIPHIKRLIELARSHKVPVVYFVSEKIRKGGMVDPFTAKKGLTVTGEGSLTRQGDMIVKDIKPLDNEVIIVKQMPSIFWGTV